MITPQLAGEVAEALAAGEPVVALETTLVSHGFSEGRGLAAAQAAEARVRGAGAIPATVGVVDGALRVGLGAEDLERFAAAGTSARKVGARDLAACIVQGALGATTVGGTLAACRATGIRFLATGGTGGVHRGFAQSLDISADLPQIARTPAVVVSSGAKSILDVTATAELLETLGVPVLGWRTPTLPLFYSADGGPAVSAVVTASDEVAAIARTHWRINGTSGLLLARPPEPALDIEPILAEAVSRVRDQGVTGQLVTPSVLALVHELSGGRSIEVNQQLIADNAALAGEVAVAYARALLPRPGPAPGGRGYPGRMSTDDPSLADPSAGDQCVADSSAGDQRVGDLCAEIERRLREAGTPARAVGAKAYLKSSMEFAGVTLPVIRRIVSDVTRGRSLSREGVQRLAEELWNRPLFECRVVALILLTRHAGELRAGDAVLVERLIRQAGTWALVDDLAGKVMGSLVERYSELGATLDRWAHDDDFWIRRSALLALLGPLRRGGGDFDRFGRYADSMLAEREFFIRKAIGWVLRDTGRRRPDLVADWLAPRAARASGVTMREAVKPLPPETARALMAVYEAGRKRPAGAAR